MAHSLRQGNPNKSNPFLSRFVPTPPLDSLTKMQTVEIKLNSFLLKQNPFEYRFFLSRCVCVCVFVCFEPKRTCQMINHFVSAFNTFPVAFALGCVSVSLSPFLSLPPCDPCSIYLLALELPLSRVDFSSFLFCLNAKSSSIMWHASVFFRGLCSTVAPLPRRGAKGRAFLFPHL